MYCVHSFWVSLHLKVPKPRNSVIKAKKRHIETKNWRAYSFKLLMSPQALLNCARVKKLVCVFHKRSELTFPFIIYTARKCLAIIR